MNDFARATLIVVLPASVIGSVASARPASPPSRNQLSRIADQDVSTHDERQKPSRGEAGSLQGLIAAIRAEEQKYRNVEYILRITTRKADPQAPEKPGEVETEGTRRVVLQGDRIWLHTDIYKRLFKTDRHVQETSAYDGEQTRTVFEGNCANVHLGRFEHPDVFPVHTLPLIHYRLNFPLSVYLSGTEAIHAHPRFSNQKGFHSYCVGSAIPAA